MTFALLRSQDAILTTPELKILYLVVRTWKFGIEFIIHIFLYVSG